MKAYETMRGVSIVLFLLCVVKCTKWVFSLEVLTSQGHPDLAVYLQTFIISLISFFYFRAKDI